MYGIWSLRRVHLINHWFVLLDDFSASTTEFYDTITRELDSQRMPGLEISTVEIPEGGSLSNSRVYLRMRRERLFFDVCSAPFGTSWFFSCRFGEIPMKLRAWEIVVMALLLVSIYGIFTWFFGTFWGSVLFTFNLVGAIFLLNALVAGGLHDLDSILLRIPVIGAFYECLIRRSTYYRDDTRSMYCTAVDRVIREAVRSFAGDERSCNVQFQEGLVPTGLGIRSRILQLFDSPWPPSRKG